MKQFNIYWSDYFDGININKDAAISLLTKDNHLIQIDTGCPFTFINYDYALKTNIISGDYLTETKNFSENKLGHKFYYIKDFKITLNNHIFFISKCYLEIDKTKEYKKKKNTYWVNKLNKQNIGYLGLDFFIDYIAKFDFINNILTLKKEIHLFSNKIKITTKNNYCIFNLSLNNRKYNVLFDTGSCSSGLIINRGLKKTFKNLDLQIKEVIRNDFISKIEFCYIDGEISFEKNISIKGNIKVEFPDKKFNSYLFYNNDFNAILGLQSFTNKIIVFDFINNYLYIPQNEKHLTNAKKQ